MLIVSKCSYCQAVIKRKVSPNHVPNNLFCDVKHHGLFTRKITYFEPEQRTEPLSYYEILAKSKGITVEEAEESNKKYRIWFSMSFANEIMRKVKARGY